MRSTSCTSLLAELLILIVYCSTVTIVHSYTWRTSSTCISTSTSTSTRSRVRVRVNPNPNPNPNPNLNPNPNPSSSSSSSLRLFPWDSKGDKMSISDLQTRYDTLEVKFNQSLIMLDSFGDDIKQSLIAYTTLYETLSSRVEVMANKEENRVQFETGLMSALESVHSVVSDMNEIKLWSSALEVKLGDVNECLKSQASTENSLVVTMSTYQGSFDELKKSLDATISKGLGREEFEVAIMDDVQVLNKVVADLEVKITSQSDTYNLTASTVPTAVNIMIEKLKEEIVELSVAVDKGTILAPVISDVQTELAALKESLDATISKRVGREAFEVAIMDDVQVLNKVVADLEVKITSQSDDLESKIKTQSDNLTAASSIIPTEVNKMKEEIEKIKEEIAELSVAVVSFAVDKKTILTPVISEIQAKLELLESQNRACLLKSQTDNLAASAIPIVVSEVQTEIEALKKAAGTIPTEVNTMIDVLKDEIAELAVAVDKRTILTPVISEVQEEIERIKEEIAELSVSVDKRAILTPIISELQEEIEAIKDQNLELSVAIDKRTILTPVISELHAKIELLDSQMKVLVSQKAAESMMKEVLAELKNTTVFLVSSQQQLTEDILILKKQATSPFVPPTSPFVPPTSPSVPLITSASAEMTPSPSVSADVQDVPVKIKTKRFKVLEQAIGTKAEAEAVNSNSNTDNSISNSSSNSNAEEIEIKIEPSQFAKTSVQAATVKQLKTMLKWINQPVSGTKEALVARLLPHTYD